MKYSKYLNMKYSKYLNMKYSKYLNMKYSKYLEKYFKYFEIIFQNIMCMILLHMYISCCTSWCVFKST